MKSINYIKHIVPALACGLVGAFSAEGQGISLNFASVPGSTIQFNGAASSFQFNTSTSPIAGGYFSGSQFQIGSEDGGTGSAIGLLGVFNGSPFSYGPITTVGTVESATVTGPASGLVIKDGSGFNLTGNVDFIEVSTHNFAGGINSQVIINLTDLSYGGSNPDLLALVGASGALSLTFQYAPGLTLADLTSDKGPYLTSFAGSVTVVPEPTTMGLLLVGLAAATVVGSRNKNKKS